jgi:hypothetical protein
MKKTLVLVLFLLLTVSVQNSFAFPASDFWSMIRGWFTFSAPVPTPKVRIPPAGYTAAGSPPAPTPMVDVWK